MNKCVKCVFFQAKSLRYNLSYCLKFNIFSEMARLDKTKCGPKYTHFVQKVHPYNKFSTNF